MDVFHDGKGAFSDGCFQSLVVLGHFSATGFSKYHINNSNTQRIGRTYLSGCWTSGYCAQRWYAPLIVEVIFWYEFNLSCGPDEAALP